MITLKRHLNNFLILALVFSLSGCNEKKAPIDKNNQVLVKVNQTNLTIKGIDSLSSEKINSLKSKNEILKSWTDREVLYQAAVEDSIVFTEYFQKMMLNSSKELASAIYLDKKLKEFEANISYSMLLNFYEDNKNEFRRVDNSFLINRIDFEKYSSAVFFRTELLKSDWNSAKRKLKGEDFSELGGLFYDYEIFPVKIQRLVKSLNQDEVSIIFESEPNVYSVVQLVSNYKKNEIPEFREILDVVKKRLVLVEKKKFIDELISDLYIKYKVKSFKDSL